MYLHSPVVIKLGGSLLTLSDLAARLKMVVKPFSSQKSLIVTGGGMAADEIRQLDCRFGLSSQQAHWDAIAAMTYNSEMLSRTCGNLPVVSNRIAAETAWKYCDAVLLDTSRFLREERTQQSRSLPESWSVTSDSIAAFIALHWPARKLVFCKSRDLKSNAISSSQTDDFDAWFPNLLYPLQQSETELIWLNLRASVWQ